MSESMPLSSEVDLIQSDKRSNDRINQLRAEDAPVHNWYRFVLSYPPHIVRDYLEKFGISPSNMVLDPFCGTGTTVVESKKRGIPSVGVEANPMAHLASSTKTDWHIDPDALLADADRIRDEYHVLVSKDGLADGLPLRERREGYLAEKLRHLEPEAAELLLKDSISPLPLHKVLVLLSCIHAYGSTRHHNHLRLALAKGLVGPLGNLHFGPEVGVGKIKHDAPVMSAWHENVYTIANDLRSVNRRASATTNVFLADSRHVTDVLGMQSIDCVITSPPYPNEKDYTRTTRLESVILGLLRDKHDLKALKRGLVRSNTRSVYIDDTDHTLIERHPEIDELATAIEQRRIELGKTSGFERLYARVTKLYFGGMAQHFADLRPHLRPGARLAYVVGDQASYLQVMIRTGQLLAKIADDLGYSVESIDLFRTRLATATKEQLREEVLILKWKGKSTMSPKKKIAGDASEGKANKYSEIIQLIFDRNYSENATEVSFSRDDIEEAANKLGMKIKNLGDVIYSFRYRTQLPISVTNKAPTGREWSIKPAGSAKYKFVAVTIGSSIISPRRELAITRIPDSTPSIINSYALNDEQALLAKLRYNRLIDTFTGTTCYSLQNHLRTQTAEMGQVETDEVYVGVDKRGAQYVYPVQAKGGTDKINLVQIEQDAAMCKSKFASLICKPIAAQFIEAGKIALFMFESDRFGEIKLIAERHYELTTDGIDVEELSNYASRPDQY